MLVDKELRLVYDALEPFYSLTYLDILLVRPWRPVTEGYIVGGPGHAHGDAQELGPPWVETRFGSVSVLRLRSRLDVDTDHRLAGEIWEWLAGRHEVVLPLEGQPRRVD
jgi:hypothetical protein